MRLLLKQTESKVKDKDLTPITDEIAQELGKLKYVRINSGSYRAAVDRLTFLAYCVRDAEGVGTTLVDIHVTVGKYRHGGTEMRITKDITASFEDHENGEAQQGTGSEK